MVRARTTGQEEREEVLQIKHLKQACFLANGYNRERFPEQAEYVLSAKHV